MTPALSREERDAIRAMPNAGPDYWDRDNDRVFLSVPEYERRMNAILALLDALDAAEERCRDLDARLASVDVPAQDGAR